MIPYLNSKVFKRSLLKEVERLLLERGYSKEQAKKILRLYQGGIT
jgi:predicted Ser/Thr protein kinase